MLVFSHRTIPYPITKFLIFEILISHHSLVLTLDNESCKFSHNQDKFYNILKAVIFRAAHCGYFEHQVPASSCKDGISIRARKVSVLTVKSCLLYCRYKN